MCGAGALEERRHQPTLSRARAGMMAQERHSAEGYTPETHFANTPRVTRVLALSSTRPGAALRRAFYVATGSVCLKCPAA